MALANYQELIDEVADWSHRDNLTPKMDTFVVLAEAIMNKDLRSLSMEKRISVTFDDAFYTFPVDYMEIKALHIDNDGARVPIKYFSPQQLDKMFSRATGNISGFTINGGQIELRPAPSVSSPATGELTYFAQIPSLQAGSAISGLAIAGTAIAGTVTTGILSDHPMIYLSATLVQVYLFLQDTEEMAKWATIYDNQIKQANKQAQKGRYYLPQVQVA